MSEKRRRSVTTTLDLLLQDVLASTAYTVYSDRAALYIVELTDVRGFALAEKVREKVAGPDPAILRQRALAEGVQQPRMLGSAPLDVLSSVAESLAQTPEEGAFRVYMMREIFEGGAVPVIVAEHGVMAVCAGHVRR